jgi:hypothetical protein
MAQIKNRTRPRFLHISIMTRTKHIERIQRFVGVLCRYPDFLLRQSEDEKESDLTDFKLNKCTLSSFLTIGKTVLTFVRDVGETGFRS